MSKNIKLSAPWVTYFRKLEALFGEDPDIDVRLDEDKYIITLYVKGNDKADALNQLLPYKKEFGGVTVGINVVPANEDDLSKEDLFSIAFRGNPAFSYMTSIDGILSNRFTYVVFKNKVVQFYNDNLGDVHGFCSTLYQDLAKEIFENEKGFYYCTDIE